MKKSRLKFTDELMATPGRAVSSRVHKNVRESEDENVGVESAHKLEEVAEGGLRLAREEKLRSKRKAAQPEKPMSRRQQRRAIRKEYEAARKAEVRRMAVKKAAERAEKIEQFIYRHKRGLGMALGLGLVLMFLLNAVSSCSVLFESGVSAIAVSTYPSEDEAMLVAEAAYAGMEAALQDEMDNYETLHPGYHEYRYDLDDIRHDPYVLISILTALHGEFTFADVEATLGMLFSRQYILTETVEVETRYRTETRRWVDDEGVVHRETYEVAYSYYICNVTLDNFNLSYLPIYILPEEQLGLYAMYIATHGNRPDLFPQSEYPHASVLKEAGRYDIPAELLEDEVFAAIIAEAEKYIGYPYVWGGYSPKTSFDCSGFVCWVINNSGVGSVGRTSAQGLYYICTPVSRNDAKPGDLIFFEGTYESTERITHVGIYVGEKMMIHCGDPIGYVDYTEKYAAYPYYFGRLP